MSGNKNNAIKWYQMLSLNSNIFKDKKTHEQGVSGAGSFKAYYVSSSDVEYFYFK
jgi:SPX domain protein involved in polyphosphate accumulation